MTLELALACSIALLLVFGYKKLPEFLEGIWQGVDLLQAAIDDFQYSVSFHRHRELFRACRVDDSLWRLFGLFALTLALSLLFISFLNR